MDNVIKRNNFFMIFQKLIKIHSNINYIIAELLSTAKIQKKSFFKNKKKISISKIRTIFELLFHIKN